MDALDNQESTNVSSLGVSYMKSTIPWMKFIAIVFLVFGGLMVIGTLIMLFSVPIAGLLYLIPTVIIVYTNILLLGMGNSLSSFTSFSNGASLDEFFQKTRNYFMIWGILLALYILLFIVMLTVGIGFGSQFGDILESLR